MRKFGEKGTNRMNDWNVLIKKGLPPIGKPLIVTIKDNLQGMPNQLRYPVYYVKDTMKNRYSWKWIYGDLVYDLLPEVSEVIAWIEMPVEYVEGAQEECEDMSNDLISRSVLLQSLRGNVLVDVTPRLEEAIEELPTAYDVDKVMERLNELREEILSDTSYCNDTVNHYLGYADLMIEAVKFGGIK